LNEKNVDQSFCSVSNKIRCINYNEIKLYLIKESFDKIIFFNVN